MHATGYHGSTLAGDGVSLVSVLIALAELVSSPDFVTKILNSTYRDIKNMTSSGMQFLLEAWSASSLWVEAQLASSLRVDAQLTSSLHVDAQSVCSFPTAQVRYGIGTGFATSSNDSRSHDSAMAVGSGGDLGEDGFTYPCHPRNRSLLVVTMYVYFRNPYISQNGLTM